MRYVYMALIISLTGGIILVLVSLSYKDIDVSALNFFLCGLLGPIGLLLFFFV